MQTRHILSRIAPHFSAKPDEAAARPTDPLIAMYGSDVGPRARDRLAELGNQVGVGAVSPRNLTDRLFNFSDGTALGFLFEAKCYEANDPYVQMSPVRKAVLCDNMGFIETCGMLELGGGFMASVPLALFQYGGVGWGYGVTLSTLMRFRTSTPVGLADGEDAKEKLKRQKVCFPFDAESALRMLPGSEFEVTGQGRVNTNLGASAAVGHVVGMGATVGVGALLGGGVVTKDEFNLNVMALDKPGKVRVTLRNLDEKTAGYIARIRAGINFVPGSVTGVILGGMLRYYVEKMNAPTFEELLNTYTTLNALIYGSAQHRGVLIACYDFDLNEPAAAHAFENLTRLNAVPAEELAASGFPSIKKVTARENETLFLTGTDLALLGQRLLVSENMQTDRVGRLEQASGAQMVYHDSVYSKKRRNILTGTKDVHWEVVSIKNQDSDQFEPYLRLQFNENDWDFGKHVLDRFIRFADAMHTPVWNNIESQEALSEASIKHLISRAEVSMATEIFFTPKGITNMNEATAARARDAYLRVSQKILPKFAKVDFCSDNDRIPRARDLIARYRKLTHPSGLSRLWQSVRALPDLRREYQDLMGRKIDPDARLIAQADEFANAVAQLKDTCSPQQVTQFFHRIGKSKGFDYMQSIAALCELATSPQTLVHEISIRSSNVTLKNTSDGVMTHPRELIATELHRTAD